MSEASDQPGSVTQNLQKARQKAPDPEAQADLFRRYYQTVLNKARQRVQNLVVVDISDVAVSVWDTIFRGMAEGKYTCRDREEFEELLGKITYHKAVNLFNWVKRAQRHPAEKLETDEILAAHPLDEGHRQVAELYYLEGQTAEQIADDLKIDSEVVQERLRYIRRWLQKHRYRSTGFAGQDLTKHAPGGESPAAVLLFEELILSLDDKLRETVLLKLQGRSNCEVADSLDVNQRTVERRLKLLRGLLESELRTHDED